jgi:hypothetical protein
MNPSNAVHAASAHTVRPRKSGVNLPAGVAILLFLVMITLSIGAVRLLVGGFPVRTLVALALFVFLILGDPQAPQRVLREHPRAILAITFFAVLGFFVSLANDFSIGGTVQQIIEIHVQALIGLVIGNSLIRRCGLGALVGVFAVIVLVSIGVATAQFLHFEPAWSLRKWLGVLQHDGPITKIYYTVRDRTMGVSFSPVHLGTQSCLAFAAYFLYLNRDPRFLSRLRVEVIAALFVVAIACLVSGNRSPLLGVIAFTYIYLAVVNRALFLAAAAAGIFALSSFTLLQGLLLEAGLRVAETDDGSAQGRSVLAAYGVRLLMDRPFGYGLGFDSTEYWADYWQYLYYYANSDAIREHALHNYFLQVLNKYGVGAIIAVPLIIPRSRQDLLMWMAFVPYLFHIAFHNDGPLQGDFLIWYLLPVGLAIAARTSSSHGDANQAAWRRYVPVKAKDASEMIA